jgi:PAS domain S-box-containing protein
MAFDRSSYPTSTAEGGFSVSIHGSTISDVVRDVMGELDVEVVLERVLSKARELTGAQHASFDPLSDSGGARDRHEDLQGSPTASFLDVPVSVAGRPFGSIRLAEKAQGEQFTPQDEQAIAMLAELAGVAIDHAQRYTEAHEQREQLKRSLAGLQATMEVTRAIGDESDLDTILELVAERGRALVSSRVLLIELAQEDELLIAAGAGAVPPGLVGRTMPMSGSFAHQAIRARASVRIEDETSRTLFNRVGVGRLGIQAQAGLVVPLLFRDHAFGALIALDPLGEGGRFSTADAMLLEAFAASTSTAVAVAHNVAADIERLASAVRFSTDAIVTADAQGIIRGWNPGAEQVYGYTAAEAIGQPGTLISSWVVPEGHREETDLLVRVLSGENIKHAETTRVRKDGSRVDVSLSVAAIRDWYGQIAGMVSIARDITAQRQTQRVLAQSERLESIGKLAGGVAHDMNNLLTIILNHIDFTLQELAEDQPARRDVLEVRGAAERAATLVRQLLLFARQQDTDSEPLDLNEIVGGLAEMLARTLTENITLTTQLTAEPWTVEADRAQVEQVIVNLVVNARDAMPDGGTIVIATENVVLDEQQSAAHAGSGSPGEHLRLAVSDTGTGMTPEVIERALDPFYTTKPAGQGTGLGLATVYGILSKAGGHLHIASRPGSGTTIETYWPTTEVTVSDRKIAAAEHQPPAPPASTQRAGVTIMLVEDEQALCLLATRILEAAGYKVMVASRPSEARELAARHAGAIDLLITDVVMPETTGTQRAAELQGAHPHMPVLFTSGYIPDSSDLPAGAAFLAKPFSREQLLAAVAYVLDDRQLAVGAL